MNPYCSDCTSNKHNTAECPFRKMVQDMRDAGLEVHPADIRRAVIEMSGGEL